MPARILPPTDELRRMAAKGMTHREIADEVSRRVGVRVASSTVSAALHRAGAASSSKRYPVEVPWTVKSEHQPHYAARMLRLLGRRRAGTRNSEENDARLDSWLKQLEDAGAVVVYVPDTDKGFWYIRGTPDTPGVPVMRELPD